MWEHLIIRVCVCFSWCFWLWSATTLLCRHLLKLLYLLKCLGVFCCSSKDCFVYRTDFCWVRGLNRACAAHLMQEYKITIYICVCMCAHTVCKVILPRIALRNCDASFISQLYRRYPPRQAQRWDAVPFKGIAPAICFTLCLENSWEKWASNCPFSVFFVEKMVYYHLKLLLWQTVIFI